MHDTLSNKSHVQYETYTETQRNELNATLRKYLAEEVDDVEVFFKKCFFFSFSGTNIFCLGDQFKTNKGNANPVQSDI